MPAGVAVKICGIRSPADVEAAADAGARYVGFNFFEKSPRYVDAPTAHGLENACPPWLARVALTVDAEDAFFDNMLRQVSFDFLQLHGSEPPARVSELKSRYGIPVIKVIGVAGPQDLDRISAYETVADQILVDAKAPKNADLPGGNGLPFDWQLIAGRHWSCPWMLAGGLNPDNVAAAIAATKAPQVDVASGVEMSPGVKDPGLITAFCRAAMT